DQSQRTDEATRHRLAGDREVFHRALRLRSPQRFGGHLQLAHAVVLDAVILACHRRPPRVVQSIRAGCKGAAAAGLLSPPRARMRDCPHVPPPPCPPTSKPSCSPFPRSTAAMPERSMHCARSSRSTG